MLLAHFRIGNTKSNTFLHFFILINLYHAQPTTNMYNSLAFFVHKPFSFIQIAFCYFGMNHTGYQTRKWFVENWTPFDSFHILSSTAKKKKKVKKKKRKCNKTAKQSNLWFSIMSGWNLRENMASKLILQSSSKCCRLILCKCEICGQNSNVVFNCRSSQVPRKLMGGR